MSTLGGERKSMVSVVCTDVLKKWRTETCLVSNSVTQQLCPRASHPVPLGLNYL